MAPEARKYPGGDIAKQNEWLVAVSSSRKGEDEVKYHGRPTKEPAPQKIRAGRTTV